MSYPTHHPRAVLTTTSPSLSDLLLSALLDRLSGHPEGAAVYEEMAQRHPEYTTVAFWCHLIATAKRQVMLDRRAAALVTLNQGLEERDRFSAQSGAMILEAIKPYLPQMWPHEASALTTLLG